MGRSGAVGSRRRLAFRVDLPPADEVPRPDVPVTSPAQPVDLVAEEAMSEAHVPTQQPEAGQEPRLSPPDVDAGGAGHPEGTAPEGPRSAVGLIWRVRD